jgi:hypothetical protein
VAVDEKIIEAGYFLDKIKRASESKDFNPNLSAFLCSMRSIPEYLLEDYNVKYGLKIPLDKPLNIDIFDQVANQRNNPNALAFIKGYNSNFKKLKRDKISKLLLTKRNIKVHRTGIPLQTNVNESIVENAGKQSTSSKTQFKWMFDDYKEAGVVEVCEELLLLMKDIVKTVTSKFP